MAEIELSVLSSQCLIPDKDTLVREVTTWMYDRNIQQLGIDWLDHPRCSYQTQATLPGDPAMTVL
jgi:hypothetical protein